MNTMKNNCNTHHPILKRKTVEYNKAYLQKGYDVSILKSLNPVSQRKLDYSMVPPIHCSDILHRRHGNINR